MLKHTFTYFFCIAGYIHVNGGGSSAKSGGGGGLIGISYTNGYVTGEVTAYGGSGVVENGAAGVTYIKAGLTTKKVSMILFVYDVPKNKYKNVSQYDQEKHNHTPQTNPRYPEEEPQNNDSKMA